MAGSTDVVAPSAGRPYLRLGLAAAVLGVVGFFLQFSITDKFFTPWYVPISATIAVVLVTMALWRRRSLARILALVFVGLLAGAEWAGMSMLLLPTYAGPVKVGEPFPAFAALKADGSPFTQKDFEGDKDNMLFFFRGRW